MKSNEDRFFEIAAKGQPRSNKRLFMAIALVLFLWIGVGTQFYKQHTVPTLTPVAVVEERIQPDAALPVPELAPHMPMIPAEVNPPKLEDIEPVDPLTNWICDRMLGVWKSDTGEIHDISDFKWIITKPDKTMEDLRYSSHYLYTKDSAMIFRYAPNTTIKQALKDTHIVKITKEGDLIVDELVLHLVTKGKIGGAAWRDMAWRGAAVRGTRLWIANDAKVGKIDTGDKAVEQIIKELQEAWDLDEKGSIIGKSKFPRDTPKERKKLEEKKTKPTDVF